MRDIDTEILNAQDELDDVKGTECEVYTRICGYFRPLKNWNQGKKAEFAERKNYGVRGRVKEYQA